MLPRRSFLLTDLTWVEVEAHLALDSRLIVPVGCCDQFGPHLPIGTASLIAEAFAVRLSQDFGVIRAPTLPFGVNLPAEKLYPGAASLGEKTLHRIMNDLVGDWEDRGFTEFILLTAHGFDPHVEALATISATTHARARVVEVLGLDLSALIQGKRNPAHAGEVVTSLMLHLHPERVQMDRIEDFFPYGTGSSVPRSIQRLPQESPGILGFPSLASAETGRRIFDYVLQKIRDRIFLTAEPEE